MVKKDTEKAVVRNISNEVEKAIQHIGTKYGYDLKVGNGSIDPEGNFQVKLLGNKYGALSAEAQRYQSSYQWMGLPELGTTFSFQGTSYTIKGMNTTGTKVMATSSKNSKTYLFSTDYVRVLCKPV